MDDILASCLWRFDLKSCSLHHHHNFVMSLIFTESLR